MLLQCAQKQKTHLHCQTQFQSLRTGWGLSSVNCPSSSSIRASASGGAHSWSRSVAARIRFPEDTKAATLHTSRPTPTTTAQRATCTQWLLHNAHHSRQTKWGLWVGAMGRIDWIDLDKQSAESVKHRRHRRTLWVPGQVVGDGIEEKLSCLLPLIVKLLLVTEEQHKPCNVTGTRVGLKSRGNWFKTPHTEWLKDWHSCSPYAVCLGWWKVVQRCRLCFHRMQQSKNKELCSSSKHYSPHQCFCTVIPTAAG